MKRYQIARVLLAIFFVVAGVNHFVSPGIYLAIMPPSLPWPAELVAISGAAEIAGGIGVLFRTTRRSAGIGLIALLLAVFPANLHATRIGMTIFGHEVPQWALWLRLPMQLLIIGWTARACFERGGRGPRAST